MPVLFSEEPPPLPKKIRSCCLYKYPDWVQGMVGEGKPPVSGGGGSQYQQPASSHWHPPAGSGPSTTTTSGRPPLPHSMREAQYHSAATSQQNFQQTPTQLDPGLLLDSSKRTTAARGGMRGANSLLKQAIANRLKETPPEEKEKERMDRSEVEMSRSIVGNPAWYRDDDGRTGFKPREWENLPNQQKDQVKKRRDRKREEGVAVDQIDEELLKERREQEQKREEKVAEPPKELSKEELKELKRREKEEKKEEKKREKEEKKREKEEKKRLEKEEKERRKSQTSLELRKEEQGIQEGTMELEQKKERRRSKSKDREGFRDRKAEETKESKEELRELRRKENEKNRSREERDSPKGPGEKKERSSADRELKKKELELPKKHEEGPRRDSTTSVASSSKSTDTVRYLPGAGKPPRHPSTDRVAVSSPSSSNEEDRRAVVLSRQPRRTNIGERRDSSMSESSRISGVSHKSVTFSDRVQTHEIERIVLSSSEDDVGVMSDDELSRPDGERRRKLVRMLQEQSEQPTDSEEDDFEEQERLVEQRMLEEEREMMHRHQGMYPVYSLDETGSQDSFYPEDIDPDRYLLEDDGSYISLDKLPAAVRRAIVAEMAARRPREDEVNMGSMSKLHEESPHSPQTQHLPRSASGYLDDQYMMASYQQAMYGAFHHDHEAAGPPETAQSPEEQVPTSPQVIRAPRTLGERRQLHQLHESFYDNVPSRTSSLVGIPPGAHPPALQERRGSDSRVDPSPLSQQETPVPSPPRRESSTSIERKAFFESMNHSIGGVHGQQQQDNLTPSPPRVIVSQSNPQRVVVTTTTTSTMLTNRTEILEKKERDEEAIRRKFVREFGARRAPRAEAEDPLDPGPTNGSRESVYSTDSRESVVSEASIRKENFVRRNFNY